jgi:hypothetical protein
VVGKPWAGPAQLLRNDAGVFVDASNWLAPHASSDTPLAADVDDDGDVDLMLAGQWQLNAGNGTFTASATPAWSSSFVDELLFADVDDDGDPDWLGFARNHHRQLVDALPPRLGLHGELTLHARPAAGSSTAGALLLLGPRASAPIALGTLGRLHLDPAALALHSAPTIPSGGATVRYLCPNAPVLLGTVLCAQALFLHGASPAQWRLGNVVALWVLL